MNGFDVLLILLLAAALCLAVRRVWRTRKTGGCGCGCDGCASAPMCGARPAPKGEGPDRDTGR